MTLMNLHMLVARLKSSGLCVFTTRDVARLADVSVESAAVYVHRMRKDGTVFPVERGKLSVSEDPFAVATQLAFPSYLSFSSAFYLHGRMEQVVDSLIVVTSRRRRDINFLGMSIEFVRFDEKRIFGYRKVEKGNSYVLLADIEKSVVDALYMPRRCPFAQARAALDDGFNRDLLEEYAKRMGSEAVVRRAGYLVESLGMKTRLRARTRVTYKLNPSIQTSGKRDPRWGLYINEVFE